MQLMAEALKRISLEYGLKINSEKTNLMHIGGEGTITLDGKNLAEVRQVKFLGSQITDDGNSRTEVNKRLTTARTTAMKIKNIWKDKEISLELKRDLAKSLIWYIVLYGCEAWTLKKEDEKSNAFELWLWRRLLGVCWLDHVTNEDVRQRVGVAAVKGLLEEIKKKKRSGSTIIGREEERAWY